MHPLQNVQSQWLSNDKAKQIIPFSFIAVAVDVLPEPRGTSPKEASGVPISGVQGTLW